MKNIKSITLGILIGAVTTLSFTALAAYIVVPNSFPVKVNGQTVQVEGYNINDSTYFKLRDVADAVGGFEVGFEDNAIIVNTPQKPTSAPIQTPTSNVIKPTLNPNKSYNYTTLLEYYTDDGLPVYNIDEKHYINAIDIFKDTDFDWQKFDDNYILDYNSSMRFVLIEYYTNTVLANPDKFKKD